MTCDTMQTAVSERMDGELLPGDVAANLETHLQTCASCRAFLRGAERIRSTARIRPAEDVPDLRAPIMRALRQEPIPLRRRVDAKVRRTRAPAHLRPRHAAPVAAALLLGLLVGSAVVGGPWQRPSTTPVAMASVIRDSQAAAGALNAYRAAYTITERGLSPDVPERHLSMDVAFAAPQRYRVDVTDLTTYPSRAWTPTDLTYIANGRATFRRGPSGCPGDLPVHECPRTRATITRASASSIATSPPSDLVIPLTSLGEVPGAQVTGTGTVSGHAAVRVQIPFAQAEPLFSFTELGGTWRPFYPTDRVVLWLDQEHWFPLRYTVYPSSDPGRRAWELRFGLPVEPAGAWIFDVRARGFEGTPRAGSFRIPRVQATQPIPFADLFARLGYVPLTPMALPGFHLSAATMPAEGGAASPTSILTYTRGLSYLVIAQRPHASPAGSVAPGPSAQEVRLSNGGLAYYAAPTQQHGRTLFIRSSSGTTLYLETNLTRDGLLAIAGSLSMLGQVVPPPGSSG